MCMLASLTKVKKYNQQLSCDHAAYSQSSAHTWSLIITVTIIGNRDMYLGSVPTAVNINHILVSVYTGRD